MTASVSISAPIEICAGITGKKVTYEVIDYSADCYAYDFGLFARFPLEKWLLSPEKALWVSLRPAFGIVWQNPGGEIEDKFDNTHDLAQNTRTGCSFEIAHRIGHPDFPLTAIDATVSYERENYTANESEYPFDKLGAQVRLYEALSLRIGHIDGDLTDSKTTWGFGVSSMGTLHALLGSARQQSGHSLRGITGLFYNHVNIEFSYARAESYYFPSLYPQNYYNLSLSIR